MNALDRKRLDSLYDIISEWPLWSNQVRTLTETDAIPFFLAVNLDRTMRLTLQAIRALSRYDDPCVYPDGVLDELENLIAELKAKAPT
jgi:hypothetical protein